MKVNRFVFRLLAALLLTMLMTLLPAGILAAEPGADAAGIPVVSASRVASTGKIRLTWSAVEGAEAYLVFRADSQEGPYTLKFTTANTSYINTAAGVGECYWYRVAAVSADGSVSESSAPVSAVCRLPRPAVTSSNVASTGRVRLTWAAVDGAVQYRVYRAEEKDGPYKRMLTTENTTYTNTSAVPGCTYYYKVTAVAEDSAANSAASAVVSAVCRLARPSVTVYPEGISGKPLVSWGAVTGAAAYTVWRAETDEGAYQCLATVTGTRYTDTTAETARRYCYKVAAVGAEPEADSAFSTVKHCTCDLATPRATVTLTAAGKPRVTWRAVEGATRYKVYRAEGNGQFRLAFTTANTSYTNTSAVSGVTYSYKLLAVCDNTAAGSAFSNTVTIAAP